MVVVLIVVLVFSSFPILAWFLSFGGNRCCVARPASLGMAGSVPTSTACGTTAGALYFESVQVTGTSATITTNTLGLKVAPTSGEVAVTNLAPPASGSPCPTSGGFYVTLINAAAAIVACWTGVVASGSPVWSAPSGSPAACPSTNPTTAVPVVTITSGQSFVVYMYGSYVPPMAGTYTMVAFGLNGASVSGSVDL
jgi:hypothetical protein